MARFQLSSKQKLVGTIAISFAFFVAEIAVAFTTGSLALLADAFHYMNDLIGFIVALTAIIIPERSVSPQDYSFGWARASLLGAFFNGVFLLALGISIFLQSIERFIDVKRKQHPPLILLLGVRCRLEAGISDYILATVIGFDDVDNPKLVLIMGCIGLTLNIISATLLHEHHGHDHGHGHSHGHVHGESEGHSHAHEHEHEHEHSHSEGHRLGPVNIETGLAGPPSVRGHTNPSPNTSHSATSAQLTPLQPISAHAEHRHTITNLQSTGRDLGMLGVLIHVLSDALNNIAVIVAAVVIWLANGDGRFYADPGVSMFISIIILLSSLPLVKNSGKILMQSSPQGLSINDVQHDLEKIDGIESVHELHIWRLDQKKTIASAHVVVSNQNMNDFIDSARVASECLHAYGIHSATLQPELAKPSAPVISSPPTTSASEPTPASSIRRRRADASTCQMVCGSLCENLMCCTGPKPL